MTDYYRFRDDLAALDDAAFTARYGQSKEWFGAFTDGRAAGRRGDGITACRLLAVDARLEWARGHAIGMRECAALLNIEAAGRDAAAEFCADD